MRRRFTDRRLVVASHNQGKVREIAELLRGRSIEIVAAGELGLPEPDEIGATFVDNAMLKAKAAASAAGLPALADDSGLAVDALDGAPGIHSARWAGPDRDFGLAMRTLENELEARGARSPAARTAHFVCALCLAWPDGHHEAFAGRVDGTLVWPPRGSSGFGYDPIFLPDDETQTFGEMEPARKHALSHRARAFAHLVEACLGDA
jgi:XTP/dITP diphosphohydrolase